MMLLFWPERSQISTNAVLLGFPFPRHIWAPTFVHCPFRGLPGPFVSGAWPIGSLSREHNQTHVHPFFPLGKHSSLQVFGPWKRSSFPLLLLRLQTFWLRFRWPTTFNIRCRAMSLTSKIKEIEDTVSAGIHEVYSGLNRPDYDVPPELGGDSPTQINWLVFLVIFSVAASVALGLLLDARCRGKAMDGRPRFWSLLLLLTSYLLLIPGLTNPVFSFSIIINVIGHRKTVEPEEGHPVCTETAWSLAHLLWTTGSRIGAFLVILFSMVIPALELIMLVLGEMFRFTSARCAEVFRYVIMWVQHRSKWASPDMFAYVLLVNLVRTIQHDPLILARARLGRATC